LSSHLFSSSLPFFYLKCVWNNFTYKSQTIETVIFCLSLMTRITPNWRWHTCSRSHEGEKRGRILPRACRPPGGEFGLIESPRAVAERTRRKRGKAAVSLKRNVQHVDSSLLYMYNSIVHGLDEQDHLWSFNNSKYTLSRRLNASVLENVIISTGKETLMGEKPDICVPHTMHLGMISWWFRNCSRQPSRSPISAPATVAPVITTDELSQSTNYYKNSQFLAQNEYIHWSRFFFFFFFFYRNEPARNGGNYVKSIAIPTRDLQSAVDYLSNYTLGRFMILR